MSLLVHKPAPIDQKTTIKNFILATTSSLGKPKKKPSLETIVQAGECIARTKWDGEGEEHEMERCLHKLVVKGGLKEEITRLDQAREKPYEVRKEMLNAAKQAGNHFVARKI